jgi:hypothetical protein
MQNVSFLKDCENYLRHKKKKKTLHAGDGQNVLNILKACKLKTRLFLCNTNWMPTIANQAFVWRDARSKVDR